MSNTVDSVVDVVDSGASANTGMVSFATKIVNFLEEAVPVGSGKAIPRAQIAAAVGIDKDALITNLVGAGLLPGWSIRGGRDGGVYRVGEVRVAGDKTAKFSAQWLETLAGVLTRSVPSDGKGIIKKNDVAREMAKVTGQDALDLVNQVGEALRAGLVPGWASRRGSGIHAVSVAAAEAEKPEAISADGHESVDGAETTATDATNTATDGQVDTSKKDKKSGKKSGKK